MTRATRSQRASRTVARIKKRQSEPGYDVWHRLRHGRCAICGRRGTIFRHHLVYEQHVRVAGGDPWDLRNALDVGGRCWCHANHHVAAKRIPRALVTMEAMTFARELLGPEGAEEYFDRYYGEE